MRYHSEKPKISIQVFGINYICDHPLYGDCTLYADNGRGFSVIQQKFDPETKTTWWSSIDPWVANAIYVSPGFIDYFNKIAQEPVAGLYPTVTVRQAMWALRMKPLKKERWETVFDRSRI